MSTHCQKVKNMRASYFYGPLWAVFLALLLLLLFSSSALAAPLVASSPPPDPLSQKSPILLPSGTPLPHNWPQGVVKYDQSLVDRPETTHAFQAPAGDNLQAKAASDLVARLSGSNSNGNGGNTSVVKSASVTEPSFSFFDPLGWLSSKSEFGPLSLPNWTLVALLLVLLLALLAALSLLVTSYRRRREFSAAERKAAIEAQRIAALEASSQPASPDKWVQQPTIPIQQSPILPPHPATTRTSALPKPDLRCPRCHESVPPDANYCSNCRLLLSPTESGLHLRVKLNNTAPQPIVLPPASTPAPATSPASPFPATLQSQPTQTSQLAPLRPGSIVDHPTIEMSPALNDTTLNGTIDQTLPLIQMQGRRLGFAVGTHSDPGIKRKFKPNEDSLFAAQGPRGTQSQQSPFGLFVVADGMGGHANGQDASRRAIQTLIDYMLPRLMKSSEASPEMLQMLLQEGVQQANLAVHRNNMELRADMGTTITATLVVDTTAYVCNVGDSRTYLYREGSGLSKVTHDHSVVASLVEAGIIQPDDIYTHPKRNQIYRSLGEKPNVDVDSFQVALLPGDKLLLCSDGLWDMVRDPKIEDVIKNPMPDPNQTASALIDAALEGGGEDNVSVIVISVSETPNYGLTTDFRLIAKPDSVQVPPL